MSAFGTKETWVREGPLTKDGGAKMSKPACNVVLYHPDRELLASKYCQWQVDALLGQADNLMTRCLQEFKEYSSLDYAWNEFQADLEAQEKKLGLYRQSAEQEILTREPPGEEGSSAQDPQYSLQESETESPEGGAAEPPAREPEPELKTSLDLRVEAVQRRRELSAPGRPFALDEQRDLALKRLCRHYEEAVDRACVAEQGLKNLFDRSSDTSPVPDAAETLGASITGLSIWVRESLEWLSRYHQKEATFTRVVSLRSLLNRNAWAMLKHARDSYTFKLHIPADLFRGHDNCQLRGVGMSLVGEGGAVPWTAVIRIPEEALYERSGESVEVNQADRPPCLLGRVEGRRSAREVEMCGTNLLGGASPIGRPTPGGLWIIDLVKPVGVNAESFNHIEDIILEIKAAGIPGKVTG